MNHIKDKIWLQLFIIYTRYLIGSAFVYSSIVKIQGLRFTVVDGSSYPINSPFHYFETMYQTGMYWQFLGWGQLIAGLLLMTQRFAKLGVVIFFAIMSNIFVITISIPGFSATSTITGLMLLATIVLIIWDWEVLKILINISPDLNTDKRFEHFKIWEIVGLVLFTVTVGVKVLKVPYDLLVWGVFCLFTGVIGLFFGLRNLKRIKKKLSNINLENNEI